MDRRDELSGHRQCRQYQRRQRQRDLHPAPAAQHQAEDRVEQQLVKQRPARPQQRRIAQAPALRPEGHEQQRHRQLVPRHVRMGEREQHRQQQQRRNPVGRQDPHRAARPEDPPRPRLPEQPARGDHHDIARNHEEHRDRDLRPAVKVGRAAEPCSDVIGKGKRKVRGGDKSRRQRAQQLDRGDPARR